jgi:uncharacterized membrane protein YvbJ
MTYCSNCGTKNEEGAQFCVNCGEPLYDTTQRMARRDDTCFGSRGDRRAYREGRIGEECFGLPYGRAIVGIIFGIIILIFGITWILSLTLNISIDAWRFIGPALVIVVAVLIIAGTIYQQRHRE